MNEQLSIFDLTMPYISVDKPIRLIELFSGVGSQAMALRDLGADFEHYRSVEFDEHAVRSYNAIHGTDFSVTDIRNVRGEDLGIVDKDTFTYLLTYLLLPVPRFISSRQTKGYEERLWNTFRSAVGSRTAVERNTRTPRYSSHGECAGSDWNKEHFRFS